MALLSSALRVTGRASSLSFSPRGRAFSQISDLVTSLQSLRLAKEVFTLDANQSVGAAALHLAKHGLTFAMVGDEKGQVVGMLGEQEILGFVAKTGDVATANVLLGSSAATQPIKRDSPLCLLRTHSATAHIASLLIVAPLCWQAG